MLIGFLLGCFGAVWAQKSATLVGMTVPLLAVSIPLLDVSLTILRRFLRNQPIFSADRGHIHHRLLERGLAPSRAVLVLYLVCAAAAAFALLLTHPYAGRFYGPIILVICVVVWVGIRQLRYAEFGIASRLLFGGELQRTLGGQMRLEMLAEKLGEAHSEEECWRVLSASIDDFGFSGSRAFAARTQVAEEHRQRPASRKSGRCRFRSAIKTGCGSRVRSIAACCR